MTEINRPDAPQYGYAAAWAQANPTLVAQHAQVAQSQARLDAPVASLALSTEAEEVIEALTLIQSEQACALFHTEAQLKIREAQYVRASDATRAARRELESFQEQVRDALIDLEDRGHIATDKLDEILDELDLEGRKRTYKVTVVFSKEVEIEVEATSEDEAADEVDNRDADEVLDDFRYDSWDIDVRHVTQA